MPSGAVSTISRSPTSGCVMFMQTCDKPSALLMVPTPLTVAEKQVCVEPFAGIPPPVLEYV